MAKKRKGRPRDHDPDPNLTIKKQKVEFFPEGVHHYEALEEVPWDLQKYVGVTTRGYSGESH